MLKNILTIDDSSSIRQIVKLVLEKEGYNVSEAGDGLEALEKINHGEYNLLLVDVNMPNMDGITFVKEARKIDNYRRIPIVMLTTEGQDEKKAEGQKAGANGWIVKPFDPNQFTKVVNMLVNAA